MTEELGGAKSKEPRNRVFDELVLDLVAELRQWTPPTSVDSEETLDGALLAHVRDLIRERRPDIPPSELVRWVAGHGGETKEETEAWSASKDYQVVQLWGAGKNGDSFIYEPDGRFRLPKAGISLEIKYVPPQKDGKKAASYASAIATTAGQLLAYSVRTYHSIGFVWIDGPRRAKVPKKPSPKYEERSKEFLSRLPDNSTLIVRFRGEPSAIN